MVVAAAPEGVNVQVPATDVIVWPAASTVQVRQLAGVSGF